MRKFLYLLVMLLGMVSAVGCSTSAVTRVDVDKPVDLSGLWNDTDARKIASEMIGDVMRSPWEKDFRTSKNRAPVVIIGPINNHTAEHINTEVFTKDIEKSFVRSGRVKVVASRNERGSIRQERAEQQQGMTDPETIKAIGKETGADFMLTGSVNAVQDEYRGRYVILYQANLELIDLQNNQKVWVGESLLKKIVKRSKYSL